MATRSVAALLGNAIDYAGMFPPAGLPVREAVTAYCRYRDSPDAWILGVLVVAVEHFGEVDGGAGPLSVVMRAPTAAAIDELLQRCETRKIAALEAGPAEPAQIAEIAAAVPPGIQLFFEAPVDDDLERRLDAIATCRALAKMRTGGLTPDAFPPRSSVYRFLRACADRRLASKATAGLHHAVSGRYPITYERGSTSVGMFGFVNVSVAAALVHAGEAEHDVLEALAEASPAAFTFDDEGIAWRGRRLSTGELATMREALFRSFGSCSLREPIDELSAMKAI